MKKIILLTLTLLLLAFYTIGQNNSDILKEFSTTPNLFDKSRISYYINSEKLNPNDYEGYYYRGIMNLENGLYQKAIENFRHVILPQQNVVGGNDGFAEPYFNIGLCKSMLQEYDSALFYYDRTIEINPLHSEAHNERGILYMSYGEYEWALKEFEDAWLYNVEAMHSYYNIAYIKYLMGDEKEAKKILKKVIKKFPEYDMSYALSGSIDMENKKYKKAEEKLSKALALNPYNDFALGNRALNRVNLGFANQSKVYLELAYEDLQKLISLDSTYAKAYSVCSVIDMILEHYDKALKNAYMATKIIYENPEYYATTYPIDRLEFYLFTRLYDGSYLPGQEKELAVKYLKYVLALGGKNPDKELEEFEKRPDLTVFMQQLLLYHYLKIADHEKATLYVDQLLQSDNAEIHLKVIKALLMTKLPTGDQGSEYLQELAKNDSSYAFLHFTLGLQYAHISNYEDAVDCYNKAIEIAPEYVVAYQERGRAYDFMKDFRASLNDAVVTLLLDETDFYGWYLAGRSYNKLSEPDSAIQCLDLSISLKPDYIYPYLEKQYSYTLKMEFEKAPTVLDQYIRTNPDSYLGYLYRGKSKAGYDTKAAFKDIDKAKQISGISSNVYEAYGDVYYENMQDYRAAIDNYKNAASLRPGTINVCIRIALCYYYLEEYVSAITYYEKAMEIDSANVFVVNNTGHCFSKLGNYNKAVEYFVKAIEIDSTYTNAVGNAGWNYYLLGEYDLSIKYSLRAIELDSTAYYAMFNRALATLRLAKVEEAKALYAKYYEVVKDLDREKYNGAIEDLKQLVNENNMAEEARAILKDYFNVEM